MRSLTLPYLYKWDGYGGLLLADAVCSSLPSAGALGLGLCAAVQDRNPRKLRCTTILSFVCGLETA